VASCSEHITEPSGSKKCGEILNRPKKFQLSKDSAAWSDAKFGHNIQKKLVYTKTDVHPSETGCTNYMTNSCTEGRLHLKCDGTRAETRFRLSAKWTSLFKSAGGVSSVDYWQASCAHQPAGFVLLLQARVLQSCDAYWLPTPFSCFPFTSPPMRRVPSHFKWTLP
jgi:hypothetical protein